MINPETMKAFKCVTCNSKTNTLKIGKFDLYDPGKNKIQFYRCSCSVCETEIYFKAEVHMKKIDVYALYIDTLSYDSEKERIEKNLKFYKDQHIYSEYVNSLESLISLEHIKIRECTETISLLSLFSQSEISEYEKNSYLNDANREMSASKSRIEELKIELSKMRERIKNGLKDENCVVQFSDLKDMSTCSVPKKFSNELKEILESSFLEF